MLKLPLFYLRILLIWSWFFLTFFCGIFIILFRWRDPSVSHWVGQMLHLGVRVILRMRTYIHHEERTHAHQPCVYTANHQSNFDILVMGDVYPKNTVLIGKKELLHVPIFNLFFIGSGHIFLDRKNRTNAVAAMKEVAVQILKRRVSVWIFPEGTRNRGSAEMLPFKKGGFRLAIEAQVPIVPIVQQHVSRYLDPKNHRLGGVEFHMKVLEPIPTKGLTEKDCDHLMQLVRKKMEDALRELNSMPIVST